MKTAIILGLVGLTLSLSTNARPPVDPQPTPPQQQGQDQGQAQLQAQGQLQGQGQAQTANGGDAVSASESAADARSASSSLAAVEVDTVVDASSALAVGVTTGGTVVDVEGDTVNYKFPSNTSYAPSAYSNMKCGELIGAGYTNLNGSGSIGLPLPRWLSRKIRDCQRNADANWLVEMNMPLAAIEARCGTKSMQERFGGNMRGSKNRTRACTTNLISKARDEAELEGLRKANTHLHGENQKLREDLADSQESKSRCTEAWGQCLKK